MRNKDFYPQFRAVLCEIEAWLQERDVDETHHRLMQRALGKLRRDFLADKVFPAMLVPTLAWQALGRQESDALYVLNAAHFLFYAFLDLTDDVEDHELSDPLWQQLGEPLAINAGTSLLFAALLMLDRLEKAGIRQKRIEQLRRLFSEAGWALTIGQHRDLASWRWQDLDTAFVLETHKLKTGTSVRLYLESAALLAGAKPAQQQHFAALGQNLGLMVQILGDWLNLQQPLSSDLKNHCQSLPLVLLRQQLPLTDADTFQAAWTGAADPSTALAANTVIRHLLHKHAIAGPMNALLSHYRQRALEELERLRRSGCEVEEIR